MTAAPPVTGVPSSPPPPALRREPSAAFGDVFARKLAELLGPAITELARSPHLLARAVAENRLDCGPCVLRKARFHREHAEEIRFALARAAEAAEPGTQPDIAAHLPEHLRPDPSDPVAEGRLPWQHAATTQIDGTLYCDWDAVALEARTAAQQQAPVPQQPGQPVPPRKQFLIAHTSDVGAVARGAAKTPTGIPRP